MRSSPRSKSNPDGKKIQDGGDTLQKQMSAASAVELMLSNKSRSNLLIIPEGYRNAWVYELIDSGSACGGDDRGRAKDD